MDIGVKMTKIWEVIKYYITTPGIRHKKSGWLLAETSPEQRLSHLIDEVIELKASPHDLKEMADVMAILIHHIQAEGYSLAELEKCISEKLKQRCSIPGETE